MEAHLRVQIPNKIRENARRATTVTRGRNRRPVVMQSLRHTRTSVKFQTGLERIWMVSTQQLVYVGDLIEVCISFLLRHQVSSIVRT